MWELVLSLLIIFMEHFLIAKKYWRHWFSTLVPESNTKTSNVGILKKLVLFCLRASYLDIWKYSTYINENLKPLLIRKTILKVFLLNDIM
jgi:hypothetical protein